MFVSQFRKTSLLFLELDLVDLAKGYALPHLPRMPELRGLDTSSFDRHPTLPTEIKYKDKAREKQRQLKMKEGQRSVGAIVVVVST